jgi:hypothetical protein
MSKPQVRFFRILLAVIFMAACLRIVGYAIRFASDNLQMDFSAFYTAGESVNHGLSPYENHLNEPGQIWDGSNIQVHSRFHYPPLAANFFQLFALLPYQTAKYVWTGIAFACLLASIFISLKGLHKPLTPIGFLCLGIFVCLFYPLLILLERGQVDTLTLLLLTSGIVWIVERRMKFWAGILFALAMLLKLHCIYILPFLVLRKQWQAVLGVCAGGICLVLLSTLLNGPASTLDYLQKEIPAISNYGQATVSESDPLYLTAVEVVKDLPKGYTLKDGRIYISTSLRFDDNATLVRTRISNLIGSIFRSLLGWEPNVAVLSLIYFGIAFGLFAVWGWRHPAWPQEADVGAEFGAWQIPLAMILLCAPLTWSMNCVWLLPAVPVFLGEISQLGNSELPARVNGWVFSVCVGVLGLLLVAMPDGWGFRMLVPYGERFIKYKYVLGEILVLAGLWGNYLHSRLQRSFHPL